MGFRNTDKYRFAEKKPIPSLTSSSKAPKEDPGAELRITLLKEQVNVVEEQAKILAEQAKGAHVHGCADILLRMLDSAHLSAEQRKEFVDELLKWSSAP